MEAFTKGAGLDNPDSLYNLATMHFHGAGVEKNETHGEAQSSTGSHTHCMAVGFQPT